MDMKTLNNTPPWEWPEDAGATILEVLTDPDAEKSDRLLAAELAGDTVVVNDEMADALLALVRNPDEPEELRESAAISLGPALEHADTFGFEDEEDLLISEAAFDRIRRSLRDLYLKGRVPEGLRRSLLEASVRAPQEWHEGAVREAYSGRDAAWRLSAVFCMQFIPGFDEQILESLESREPQLHYQAVCASGSWGVDAAWDHVAALASATGTEKELRLAAIDAVAAIRPSEAGEVLGPLTNSDDEDIVDAAHEALAMADGESEWLDPDEENGEDEAE